MKACIYRRCMYMTQTHTHTHTHTHTLYVYMCACFFIAKLKLHINDNVSSCRGSNTIICCASVVCYSVTSCLLMLINGMVTTLLSESLVHVMIGVGLPSAKHFSVTLPPSVTVLPAISVIRGLTESQQGNGKVSFHQKHTI